MSTIIKKVVLGLLTMGSVSGAGWAQSSGAVVSLGVVSMGAKPVSASALAGQYRVILVNGDTLIRQSITIANDKLLGDGVEQIQQVDLKQIVLIRLIDEGDAWRHDPGPRPIADTVRLKNGDVLSGLISGSDGSTLQLVDVSSTIQELQTSAIQQISFAPTGPVVDQQMPSHVMLLADGTILSASDLAVSPDRKSVELKWQLDGLKRTVPAASVVSIYDLSQALPLTMLNPRDMSGEPFVRGEETTGESLVGVLPMVVRMDVRGFEVEGKRFENAIVMRPSSRMTFDVPAGANRLRAKLSMGDGSPLGSCVTRIKSGEKLLAEFTQKSGMIDVDVDLAGHAQITLDVDFGENYGIQSRAVWLDPFLVRE